MAPPAALLDEYREELTASLRPTKRVRVEEPVKEPVAAKDDDTTTAVRRHPLGVRPSGNAFLSATNLRTFIGSFAFLPDEVIAQVLDYFDAPTLLRLGASCRALHAFTRNEELWRALFVE